MKYLVPLAVVFAVAILFRIFSIGGRAVAPYIGRRIGALLPAAKPQRAVEVARGFNAAVGTDAAGNARIADSFEEWLDACVPEDSRYQYNNTLNRIGFWIYKTRHAQK